MPPLHVLYVLMGRGQFFPTKPTSKAGSRGVPLPGSMAACVHMRGGGGGVGGEPRIGDAFSPDMIKC